ncbi:MAG: hypothetical protein ABIS86_11310, partial [Streptosporangiaceae bacterium]
MFGGAVSLLIDSLAKDTPLRWPYLTGFTLLGLALSGSGAWLLGSARAGVGLSLAATDPQGDPGRYQSDADDFAQYGAAHFLFHTTVQAQVVAPADLRELHNRLDSAVHTLNRAEPRARTVGLLFTGRHEVGFHVGGRLRPSSRRFDLYFPTGGTGDSHFPAVRLAAAPSAEPRPLELRLATDADFAPITLQDLTGRFTTGTCLALAVNVVSPAGNATFAAQILQSARAEGAAAVVVAELPAGSTHPMPTTTHEFESTVAAIAAVAAAMPAAPGLLYLRAPVIIAVALGRYLHNAGWIPMRHDRATSTYERFLA